MVRPFLGVFTHSELLCSVTLLLCNLIGARGSVLPFTHTIVSGLAALLVDAILEQNRPLCSMVPMPCSVHCCAVLVEVAGDSNAVSLV